MPKNAAERKYYEIDDSKEVQYVLAKDKEAQSVSVNWIFRKPVVTNRDEKFLRDGYAQGMFNQMFNTRLSELIRKPIGGIHGLCCVVLFYLAFGIRKNRLI